MTLKTCPCCDKKCTTKNSKFLGRLDGLLYFNCVCGSTFVLVMKKAMRLAA